MKNIAMIPARLGSERLKKKNLALLNGKPLVSYAVQAAIDSGEFDRVVVNGDNEVFAKVAKEYGVEFYLRPTELGSSATQSDDVVKDFIDKHPCEAMAWVNSIAPLQTAAEVRHIVEHFHKEELDSLMTVRKEQVHCNFEGKPLNFNLEEKFAKTQDLEPVERFVYSVMMWRSQAFLETYEKNGFALLFGKVGYFPVAWASGILVKRREDLDFCEQILFGRNATGGAELEYYG